MFGWLKNKAIKLQVANTKRELKVLIDHCEKTNEDIPVDYLLEVVKCMRGPMPKRDLVKQVFDPILKKKLKKKTKNSIDNCIMMYQDSHPK